MFRRDLAALLLPLVVAALGGCGGSTVGSAEPPPGAAAPASSSPDGPSSPAEPRKPTLVGTPDAPENVAVPFHLILSNQSFDVDPVDLEVYVDGVHVVTGDFAVGSQHTFVQFDFPLAVGEHALKVVSKRGKAERTATVAVNGERWAVVMYWWYATARGGQPADTPSISVDVQDTQPLFD